MILIYQLRINPNINNLFFKVVLVGDAGVGKTHLLNRYIKNSLPKSVGPTIGVEFATRIVNLREGGKVKA